MAASKSANVQGQAPSGLTATEILAALSRRNQLPEMDDLLTAIVGQFGGFQEFAKEFYEAYKRCKQTPMAASKMLEGVMRLMNTVNEKRTATPIEQLSTPELETIVLELMRKMKVEQPAEVSTGGQIDDGDF